MNKRGAYFFVIDALIAASIIFLTLIIIFATHNLSPQDSPTLRILDEYTEFLASTKIREYPGNYTRQLIDNHNITDLDNTLLEQLTEFHYYNQTGKPTKRFMTNLTSEITRGFIPTQRSVLVRLGGDIIYNRSNKPMQESDLVLSSKRTGYKRINQTYIYGPISLEVTVWV